MPCNFVILDMEEDLQIPIILGRPFLTTAGAIIDLKWGKIKLEVEEETVEFDFLRWQKTPPW